MKIRILRGGDEVLNRELESKGTKVVIETGAKVAHIDVLESGGFHIEVDTREEESPLSVVPDAS